MSSRLSRRPRNQTGNNFGVLSTSSLIGTGTALSTLVNYKVITATQVLGADFVIRWLRDISHSFNFYPSLSSGGVDFPIAVQIQIYDILSNSFIPLTKVMPLSETNRTRIEVTRAMMNRVIGQKAFYPSTSTISLFRIAVFNPLMAATAQPVLCDLTSKWEIAPDTVATVL